MKHSVAPLLLVALQAGGSAGWFARRATDDCSDLTNYFETCDNQQVGLAKDGGSTDLTSCCTACCNDPNCNVCQFSPGTRRFDGCWRGTPHNWPAQCSTNPDPDKGWHGMARTKFACSDNVCSPDSNGQYSDKPSCQAACQPPPPPPSPPGPPPPPGPAPPGPQPQPFTGHHNKKKVSTGTAILLVLNLADFAINPAPWLEFLRFFFAFCIPYFVGGALFRKYRLHAEGKDVVPNVEFWEALPGLIREGFAYTTLSIQVGIERGRARYTRL